MCPVEINKLLHKNQLGKGRVTSNFWARSCRLTGFMGGVGVCAMAEEVEDASDMGSSSSPGEAGGFALRFGVGGAVG